MRTRTIMRGSLSVTTVLLLMVSTASYAAEPGSCSTGQVLCCNSLVQSTTAEGQLLLVSLGLSGVGGIVGGLGVTCTPMSASGTCAAQPVCCTNNNFNGAVAAGCTPVNFTN